MRTGGKYTLQRPKAGAPVHSGGVPGHVFAQPAAWLGMLESETLAARDFARRDWANKTLDLRRVCDAPFLDRPGRLPLWQGSKREEGGLP